jgi:PAS domain S-box-containing protein
VGTVSRQEKESSCGDFLKILVAEEDDVEAFLIQCELNKLDTPFLFKRAAHREQYLDALRDFAPTVVVADYRFSGLSLFTETSERAPHVQQVAILPEKDSTILKGLQQTGVKSWLLRGDVTSLSKRLNQQIKIPADAGALPPLDEESNGRHNGFKNSDDSANARARAHLALKKITALLLDLNSKLAEDARVWAKFLHKRVQKVKDLAKERMALRKFAVNPGQNTLDSPLANGGESQLENHAPSRLLANDSNRFGDLNQELKKLGLNTDGSGPPYGAEVWVTRLRSLDQELQNATSARQEAESALQAIDFSFKTLFQTSLDAIFLVDSSGGILQANPAACSLLGLAPTEAAAHKLSDFINQKVSFESAWQSFLQSGTFRGEQRLLLTSGETRDIQFSARSNVWCDVHLFIARDLSERSRVKEQLAQLWKELEKSLEAQARQKRALLEIQSKLNWFAANAAQLGSNNAS